MNTNPQNLTEEQHNVLVGSLLGDGCLGIRKQCQSPRLTIRRQSLDLAYLEYEFEIFRNCCRDKAITTGKVFDKRYEKIYTYCNLETRYIPAFKDYYNLWYPNKKKIVPSNLILNSQIIAIWVCDDAYIKTVNDKRLNINIHTQGFSKDEVHFLKQLLDDRYNVQFRIDKVKNNKLIISGADNQTRPLLHDIDKVFPTSMSRKSDIWRNPLACFYENEPEICPTSNSKQIKKDILNKIDSKQIFTMKEIFSELNLYIIYNDGKRDMICYSTTAKRFITKLIKENFIIQIDGLSTLSINTRLCYVNKFILEE